MARKGQFKKGGGRVGSGGSRRRARRSTTTAIVVAAPRSATRRRSYAPATRRMRRTRRARGGRGSGINLLHVGVAAAGLAYLTSANGPEVIKKVTSKIPGNATFGAAATLGVGCLAVDRFVKPNKWLKLLGTAGVVLAAAQVGAKGKDFKWVGDDGYDDVADIGDDDLADVDDYE